MNGTANENLTIRTRMKNEIIRRMKTYLTFRDNSLTNTSQLTSQIK